MKIGDKLDWINNKPLKHIAEKYLIAIQLGDSTVYYKGMGNYYSEFIDKALMFDDKEDCEDSIKYVIDCAQTIYNNKRYTITADMTKIIKAIFMEV
jgi:hypothetical protein